MLELRFMSWDGEMHRFLIPKGVTRIGRTAGNELQIDDLALSSEHCVIEWDGKTAFVQDVDSSSGTFLDGTLIDRAPLKAGQTLNLGTFSIEVAAVALEEGREERSKKPEFSTPSLLADGTYSCQIHETVRATFECDGCSLLFCGECFGAGSGRERHIQCSKCGESLRSLDWSEMGRTKGDVVKELLPEGVKKALRYWEKYQDWGKGGKN